MRIRTVVGVLVGGFMTFVLAAPAAAQSAKVDFSGGYQYLRFDDDVLNIPTGWGASVGIGKEWIKFIGDVGGHYLEGVQLHTFQGGVELSDTNRRVVPFARVLSGLGVFTAGDYGEPVFVFTPEGGVKIMITDRVGAQASVGFPFMFNGYGGANGFRFFTGIVIRR